VIGESQKVLQSSKSLSVSGCSITCFCSLHLNMGFIIFTISFDLIKIGLDPWSFCTSSKGWPSSNRYFLLATEGKYFIFFNTRWSARRCPWNLKTLGNIYVHIIYKKISIQNMIWSCIDIYIYIYVYMSEELLYRQVIIRNKHNKCVYANIGQ